MKKLLMCVAMVAMLAACSKGEGEDGFIMSPMSDPDDVCSAMDDAYFMQYCYANFDINGDAKVSKAEAAAVTSINFSSYGDYYSITSIRGVEYFTNLEDINGYSLDIEVVDLRANSKLQKVRFSYCRDLVEVRLPNGVTAIKFPGCSSLTSITIPEGVTLIESDSFAYCSSLMNVYCKPTTPPRCVSWMFDYDVSGRKIYVPRASVDAYKRAEYWSAYADDIVGYDF